MFSSVRTRNEFPAPHRAVNLLSMGVALALGLGCMLFAVPAVLSGNALFATDVIRQRPAQVILYHQGQSYVFEPGDPEYEQLVEAAYTTLRNETGFYEWGWSGQRFEQARAEGTALEFIFAEPVKLPGNRIDIADPSRLFFPLEVFGYEGEAVFRGGRTEYWGLPIRVPSLDPIRQEVARVLG